jgi:hypothetical protein
VPAVQEGQQSAKGRTCNFMGTSRFSSIDKPLVSLPKRQSAVVKDSTVMSRASESQVIPLNEEEEEGDANSDQIRPVASQAQLNTGKGSSRGSLRRRVFAASNSSGYYTNSQARVQSKIRSGKGNSIGATKNNFEVETLLSNEKQIEQYFSNDKLDDQNSKKEQSMD